MQGASVKHDHIVRTGRGYSLEELKEAGDSAGRPSNAGVPVDVWRQTKHSENVDQLKSVAKNFNPKKEKPKKKKE